MDFKNMNIDEDEFQRIFLQRFNKLSCNVLDSPPELEGGLRSPFISGRNDTPRPKSGFNMKQQTKFCVKMLNFSHEEEMQENSDAAEQLDLNKTYTF
ncbi:hypothetical protein EVAR_73668_1 [Eumeta japonica]|uniref:Uncharacterized protein n=1 Tax=Eumeta variegata TaxID=151549 RepID=A0A4C1SQD0_EUMVA|nr:hypothetical protein EVAR_73668_1 [Eumeta japonica]